MLKPRTASAESVESILDAPEDNLIVKPDCQITKFFSTGSTLLNLAMTDNPFYGWPCGRMGNIVGDSSSGKSFLTLTSLAEAAHNPEFDDYLLVYDDVEFANTFDIRKLFGKLADRLRAPRVVNDVPRNSRTVEDWYANVMRFLDAGKPFIYVCDSTDALTSAATLARGMEYVKEQDKLDVAEQGVAAAPEVKGSYRMDKPKLFSEALATIVSGLSVTNSALIMISQTRDAINPTGYGPTKTRAGGRALKFYATHEMWLTHVADVKRTLKGIERKIGDTSVIKVTKNKVTGKQRNVPIHLYYSYGIDDCVACLQFINEATGGGKTLGRATLKIDNDKRDLHLSGSPDKLLREISEDPDLLMKIRLVTADLWNEIENEIDINRKPRYAE